MLKISDIANVLGVSQTTVYKKARGKLKEKLEPLTKKIDGILWFDPSVIEIFRAAITTATATDMAVVLPPPATVSPDISARLEGVEKAIFALVEEIRGLKQENNALRMRLEAPPLPTKPMKIVRPWEPIRVQAPAMPWYERFWLQMFSPEMLRTSTE